jgi:hypothetical protein
LAAFNAETLGRREHAADFAPPARDEKKTQEYQEPRCLKLLIFLCLLLVA